MWKESCHAESPVTSERDSALMQVHVVAHGGPSLHPHELGIGCGWGFAYLGDCDVPHFHPERVGEESLDDSSIPGTHVSGKITTATPHDLTCPGSSGSPTAPGAARQMSTPSGAGERRAWGLGG